MLTHLHDRTTFLSSTSGFSVPTDFSRTTPGLVVWRWSCCVFLTSKYLQVRPWLWLVWSAVPGEGGCHCRVWLLAPHCRGLGRKVLSPHSLYISISYRLQGIQTWNYINNSVSVSAFTYIYQFHSISISCSTETDTISEKILNSLNIRTRMQTECRTFQTMLANQLNCELNQCLCYF